MLICPVCRSQNMETAKFCGNCGKSFPRPSMPTSSLINCPQGHVYSAVYQFCPYCPQPEPITQSGPPSNFATRVEEPVTAFEPLPAPPSDRLEPYATNFETSIGSKEIFETRVSSVEIPEIVQPPVETVAASSPTAPQKASAPTEVIFRAPTKIGEATVLYSEPEIAAAPKMKVPSIAVPSPPPAPPMAQTVVAETPVPAILQQPEADRRTIVVADTPQLSSKGKIVGWLISYTNNPDGEDHRLFAGYNRIGANQVCDIVLQDETVSGSHSIIVYRDGRFLIKDDLSRNGTFVNGREISEAHPLQSYDQVRIGNTYLTFIPAQRIA
ncbi:MAG: FHA domain-containing protein [Blastocatellia bacterium]